MSPPLSSHLRTRLSTLSQVGEIAEAVERMSSDSPVAKERAEIETLEKKRAERATTIEEGTRRSPQLRMLDSRVGSMLANLRAELETAESSIGRAFKALDLDNDGVVSHDELLEAMAELHDAKRPDAAAFQELLDDIDIDDDGKISVDDFRRLVREMQLSSADDDDDDEAAAAAKPSPPPDAAAKKAAAAGGQR